MIVVTGVDLPLVAGLVDGLRASGETVVALPDTAIASRADADAAFAAAVAEHGPLGAVVHAAVDPRAYERMPFTAVDDDRFDAVWEQTLRRFLFVLQGAHPHLVATATATGGATASVVVVAPVVGMAGAAELAPYAAALEGMRVLAKSTARQWGPQGIRVNVVAPAPEQVPIGVASSELALSPPALGRPGDPAADLAPVVAWLCSEQSRFVTGETIGLDGGVWMAP